MTNVLITGASSGIGRGIAEYLADKSYTVFAGARKPEDINDLSSIDNIQGIKLDVTVEEEVTKAVSRIKRHGGIFGLINNAGIMEPVPMIEMSDEEYLRQLNVNLIASNRLIRAFFDQLRNHKGYIINISSLNAFISSPFSGAYSITKFAMGSYSEILRYELKKFGIRVADIEPGFFYSKIFEKGESKMESLSKVSKYYQEEYKQVIPAWKENRSPHLKDPILIGKKVHDILNTEKPRLFNVVANREEQELVFQTFFQRVLKINRGLDNPWSRDELIDVFKAIAYEG